ncbi:hypothetical protein ZIOFF_013951 [Zingiber officinale]|uniref:Uncharacterized protein n=1 Tax=Zingiber officinale TaxID=94328 RepID=A0A8J5HAW5_ZINOF|nr:hypothetical protein ZIOFF_013951 [Zingiber officinale]
MASLSSAAVAFAVVLVSAVAPAVLAQSPASAPTPAATSDGPSLFHFTYRIHLDRPYLRPSPHVIMRMARLNRGGRSLGSLHP